MTANLLHRETSPYLLQHKDNPVHWMPWGTDAFARARAEDKPVILSVGYAACHWCHVMAHESFEDGDTAALMNAGFVSIKADREERPDVDRIYMDALHALGEQGGWPLTMFLTPSGEPFWGGTYFPPDTRHGRPGFKHVLREISRLWRDERGKVLSNGQAIAAHLKANSAAPESGELDEALIRQAASALLRAVDPERGGIQGAPKFPQASFFAFLWSVHERREDPALARAVDTTMRNICQGGIYDHLGGGIARYSVDPRWLVPHFEKMLYDNAQFVHLLARIVNRTGDPLYLKRLDETVTFVLRDMRVAQDLFASSYDADSEGEEGRYYVWRLDEIRSALGADAGVFAAAYGVTPEGNFEGRAILNREGHSGLPENEARLEGLRATLLAIRAKRAPPGFDDKVLADWNGLIIAALADAALLTSNASWARQAARSFDALLATHWDGAALKHSWRHEPAKHPATADDYAHLIAAALRLHALTAEWTYIDRAASLAASLVDRHWNDGRGALELPSRDAAELIARPCFGHDDATPNANGVTIRNFATLALLTGDTRWQRHAESIHRAFAAAAASNPFGYASFLDASLSLVDPIQVIVAHPPGDSSWSALLSVALKRLGTGAIVGHVPDTAALPPDHPAYRKSAPAGRPRLYLCRGSVCAAPAETAAEVQAALSILGLGG